MKRRIKSLVEREWNLLAYYFLFIIVALIITYSWQGLEAMEHGKVMPSIADTVFALILSISVLINVALSRFLKYRKI